MSRTDELVAAFANLSPLERHGWAVAAADCRDQRSDEGDHRLAEVYATLAARASDVEIDQRLTWSSLVERAELRRQGTDPELQ